jgi:uridylate kinase
MKKEVVVISLGGSLIYPSHLKKPDEKYLKKIKKFLKPLTLKYKVVIVCGGGYPARSYMEPLRSIYKDELEISKMGVETTRLNATLVSKYLKANEYIPLNTIELEKIIKKSNIVISGALEIGLNQTTDSNAAKLASKLKGKFVNLTDVKGLYDKNPKKYKKAKFIPEISYAEFNKIVKKIKFKSGQHFVLDQTAAKIVCDNNVSTAIINGNRLGEIKKFLNNKKFIGTLIN